MRLELEILNGERKGQKICLDSAQPPTDLMPYVLETEAFDIKLTVDQEVSRASLVVGNTSISLFASRDDDRTFKAYSRQTEKGRFDALFFNYLGVAIFHADLEMESTSCSQEVGRLEVLARKSSAEQVQSMINFILTYDEEDVLGTKEPARQSTRFEQEEGSKPQRLIEQLEEHLRLLQLQLPYILNAPLSALSSRFQLQSGSPGIDMSDQGGAWLTENLSVLQPTDDADAAMLEYEGIHYCADEVQASVMYENKDIYENRIVHGYVDNLLRFTNQLLQDYNESAYPESLNEHDGYVSFFSAMSTWIKKINTTHIQHVQRLQDEIRLIQSLLQQRLPVRDIDLSLPRFTPKVRANRQYTVLFRSIHEWYQGPPVNWSNQELLLAINNIPKLFELYAVLLTQKWCSTHCTTTIKDQSAFWCGQINGHCVKLHYEPEYWMSGHLNHSGDITNTQNRTLQTANDDWLGKQRHHDFQKRSPDIVLEIEKSNGEYLLVVLDAKYTSPELAFERDLPDCTLKYVHGLGTWRTPNLVRAMIIVHPDRFGRYHDFHSSPFDIYGMSPQLPVLCAQGLKLSETATEQNEPLHKLLTRVFAVFN